MRFTATWPLMEGGGLWSGVTDSQTSLTLGRYFPSLASKPHPHVVGHF